MSKLIQLGSVSAETRDLNAGDLNDFGGFVECSEEPYLGWEIEGKQPLGGGDSEFGCENPASFETGPLFKD